MQQTKEMFPEDAQTNEGSTKFLESKKDFEKLKHARRIESFRKFSTLGPCMLCGDNATHRHSKSGHKAPVSTEDILPVCNACHVIIHFGDVRGGGASWAWRHPA